MIEKPFDSRSLPQEIVKKLKNERYAWLTTVTSTGVPTPQLVWFHFDGSHLIVYARPKAEAVEHIRQHPQVALHLESDGLGSGIIGIRGTAAVTAEGADPRDDKYFWAKYHVEADMLGLAEVFASYTVRITVNPNSLWTTHSV